ncbi:hypothetical protein CYMTET_55169 [Cymbomonas tetramitiformis]|uniref:Uncharacterized protein n=1 Tax=Cymbomonas tetramitiformis TaxID=36881 RepID=A0AAE0BFC2_9CHLO|nr:hypothetical protein CYMTET_55169 [Cymbomonas tetramitiformis]
MDHDDLCKRTIMFFALIKYNPGIWDDKVINLRGRQKRVDDAKEFKPGMLELNLLCKLNHDLRPDEYNLSSKCLWNLLRVEIELILRSEPITGDLSFDTTVIQLTAINNQVGKLYQRLGFKPIFGSEDSTEKEMRVMWSVFVQTIDRL